MSVRLRIQVVIGTNLAPMGTAVPSDNRSRLAHPVVLVATSDPPGGQNGRQRVLLYVTLDSKSYLRWIILSSGIGPRVSE